MSTSNASRGGLGRPVEEQAHKLREVFEVRRLLELWAARTAASEEPGSPGEALIEEIGRFERLQAAGDPGGDLDSVQPNFCHDVRFHELILGSVGDPFLVDAFSQLHVHLHLFRLFHADKEGSLTLAEHSRIDRVIRDAEPNRAEEAMTAHLRSALVRFSEGLEGAGGPDR